MCTGCSQALSRAGRHAAFLPTYLAGMEDDTGHIVDVAPQGVHLPALGVCRRTHSTLAAAP